MASMRPSFSRRGRVRRVAASLLLAVGMATTGCATLSVTEERQLGDQWVRQIQGELILVRDRVVVEYIENLGYSIVQVLGQQPFDYRFYVVEDPAINAFAGPGGHIFVHTGTILASRNVSELAGVMAHEVGHVYHRHVAENFNRARTTSIAHQVGVIAAGVMGGAAAAQAASLGGGLAATAYLNSFGRDAEREADAFAVRVMPGAGIDPRGLVSFFQTIQAEGGPGVPAFLSSHPLPAERIENTSALIDSQGLSRGLRASDGGRLEIIQQRVRLLVGP